MWEKLRQIGINFCHDLCISTVLKYSATEDEQPYMVHPSQHCSTVRKLALILHRFYRSNKRKWKWSEIYKSLVQPVISNPSRHTGRTQTSRRAADWTASVFELLCWHTTKRWKQPQMPFVQSSPLPRQPSPNIPSTQSLLSVAGETTAARWSSPNMQNVNVNKSTIRKEI